MSERESESVSVFYYLYHELCIYETFNIVRASYMHFIDKTTYDNGIAHDPIDLEVTTYY